MQRTEIKTFTSKEMSERERILKLFKECPIPEDMLLDNLPLFLNRRDLMRLLFIHELYKKIIDVHGVIMEFGVRWGKSMALYESLRGIYEPYNHSRKIIGFDTFEGFPSVHEKDGTADVVHVGAMSVTKNYEDYLSEILDYHEHQSPIPHIKKYQLVKGNAVKELEIYLRENPETIIALAYFDFDIYEPTKRCLELIKPHLTKGTVLGFDDLCVHDWPGETIALREVLGLNQCRIRRTCFSSLQTYSVIE